MQPLARFSMKLNTKELPLNSPIEAHLSKDKKHKTYSVSSHYYHKHNTYNIKYICSYKHNKYKSCNNLTYI